MKGTKKNYISDQWSGQKTCALGNYEWGLQKQLQSILGISDGKSMAPVLLKSARRRWREGAWVRRAAKGNSPASQERLRTRGAANDRTASSPRRTPCSVSTTKGL